MKNSNQDAINQKQKIDRKKKLNIVLLIIILSAFEIGGIFVYLSTYNTSITIAYYIIVSIVIPCPFLLNILNLRESDKEKEIRLMNRSNFDKLNLHGKFYNPFD